jgi:ABC-type phosphate/phosphonate transport system substrate-binding protein
MYDLPELREATDALWRAIASALGRRGVRDVPSAVDRDCGLAAAWCDPRLLLSQTCGYVLTHTLAGRVRVVATPCYRASGCAGSRYCSFLMVARGSRFRELVDLRGAVAAFNNDDSHSGMNALRHAVAPHAQGGRFFARAVRSGGHRASLEAVAGGRADVAAIDCVTFALLERAAPELVGATRIIGETASAPALPLVTRAAASDDDLATLRAAVAQACSDLDATTRIALRLDGIEIVPASAYAEIDALEADAIGRGYPVLA